MSFLQDYQNLIHQNPTIYNNGLKNENAEYTDYVYRSHNIYYAFDSGTSQDTNYLFDSFKCQDCFDCSYCYECELCYETTDGWRCYNCGFVEDCTRCRDCYFCCNCRDCHDCFGCVWLNHKKYCIFNEQYSKEEYFKRLSQLWKQSVEQHLKKVEEIKLTQPWPRANLTYVENCTYGDYVYQSKNCYWCFDSNNLENCLYVSDTKFSRDCVDCSYCYEIEFCWQCCPLGHSYNCSHISHGDYLRNCHFCTHCYKSEDLFGCVNLSHAKYCILNKQYLKEEYFAKVKEIRKELGWSEPTQVTSKPSK